MTPYTLAAVAGTLAPHPLVDHHAKIDALEQLMMSVPAVECPVFHRFTKGLYTREYHARAGTIQTSKIHRTEHQFILSKGRVTVWSDEGQVTLEAPYHGVTKPGTRRVLFVHEDIIWTTFHATEETDVDVIESQIIEPHRGHLAGMQQPELPMVNHISWNDDGSTTIEKVR